MSSISDHAIPTVYSLKSLFLPFTVKSETTAKILHIHNGESNSREPCPQPTASKAQQLQATE